MVFSLSSQSILRVVFSVILITYLLSAHLLSMYRKIKQAKFAIIDRLNELKLVADDEIVKGMIGDLLTEQIVYYQRLLTSPSGTALRMLNLVKADDEYLIKMVKEHDSVHTH